MVNAPAYEVVVHDLERPKAVEVGGENAAFDYDPARRAITVIVKDGAAGFSLKVEK
jgi:hypothetical protein